MTIVDRESANWKDRKGMDGQPLEGKLPLLEGTDCLESLNELIDRKVASKEIAKLPSREGDQLILMEMHRDQDMKRFIEIGKKWQVELDHINTESPTSNPD